jgi:PAS domain S-box-containing protein
MDVHLAAVDDRWCEIVGRPRKELVGALVRDLTHPLDVALSDELNRQLMTGEIPEFHTFKRYVRGDGSPVWVRESVRAVDLTGSLRRAVATVEELTITE